LEARAMGVTATGYEEQGIESQPLAVNYSAGYYP
jgi:hypothetical protein